MSGHIFEKRNLPWFSLLMRLNIKDLIMKNRCIVLLSFLFLFVAQGFAGNAMVLVFDTRMESGTTVTLPLQGTVDVTVDWGVSSAVPFAIIVKTEGVPSGL